MATKVGEPERRQQGIVMVVDMRKLGLGAPLPNELDHVYAAEPRSIMKSIGGRRLLESGSRHRGRDRGGQRRSVFEKPAHYPKGAMADGGMKWQAAVREVFPAFLPHSWQILEYTTTKPKRRGSHGFWGFFDKELDHLNAATQGREMDGKPERLSGPGFSASGTVACKS